MARSNEAVEDPTAARRRGGSERSASAAPGPVQGTSGRYAPISDYAVIGDTRSCALISRGGSIDWLCWPRFDSPSVFARLLDASRGGHFSITPVGPYSSTRRYVGPTNVLETTFTTPTGVARLTDLMPVADEREKRKTLAPFRHLLRRVEVCEGTVGIRVEYAPRPDYGRQKVRLERRGELILCIYGPQFLHLRAEAPLDLDDDHASVELELNAGERRDFALAVDDHSPAVFPAIGDGATERIERTLEWWTRWSSHLSYEGPYRDAVLRSVLILKLLTYAPSGAVVAAPTTSLPEWPQGVRNWDYRYCWLRDASFTVAALYDCGFSIEGGAFVDWLLYATRLTHPGLQILYDVFGESKLTEFELKHLEGYGGAHPVRIGNAAHDQFQLDVYGEVLGAVEEYTDRGEQLYGDTRRMILRLVDIVMKRWREPDSGIWEKRGDLRQHVHAKIMAWAALDSAERLVQKGRLHADPEPWRRVKDEIHALVLAQGRDPRTGSLVSELGGHELDSSLLYAARVGFLHADDPVLDATIDAIRRSLGHDDLLYRYPVGTDDGLPPGEGAFLACSMWLVEALAIAKREKEARELFEKLLKRANDVGLFSEEAEVESGAALGNFPQALTHIGLLNAALRLEQPQAPRGKGGQASEQSGQPSKEKGLNEKKS